MTLDLSTVPIVLVQHTPREWAKLTKLRLVALDCSEGFAAQAAARIRARGKLESTFRTR